MPIRYSSNRRGHKKFPDISLTCMNPVLHTKYIICGPHGVREEDFLSFSHYKSMGANDP